MEEGGKFLLWRHLPAAAPRPLRSILFALLQHHGRAHPAPDQASSRGGILPPTPSLSSS